MTATRDGAYLAHISDSLTAIAEQLDEQRAVQQNVLTVLNALLETNRPKSSVLPRRMPDRHRLPWRLRRWPRRSGRWTRTRRA